ncbi:MAG TPA: permease [Solirubrobacteraceae bacterium]|nr:permease [Solirubrobacteraceae bacterium]
MDPLRVIEHGLRDALLMTYQVWWALVLGFAVSAVVQARVPRERVQAALSGSGPRPVALATALGAASSSCSYAAVAIARSLLAMGASAASALAFQLAATNLVVELGAVLWVLLGWQFTLAEYLGGIVMIVLIAVALRRVVPPELERRAREHALQAAGGHEHGGEGGWSAVAEHFRGDWRMLWREIALGMLLAGFAAQLGRGVFSALLVRHAPAPLPLLENVLVGPLVAVASFVCSVGNVPLAAVLWSGGISFAGVLAFLFADLVVLPILAIYRKYYGRGFATRITALMLGAMALSALIVDGIFSGLGLIPGGARPSHHDIFGSVRLDHTLVLDVLATLLFAALIGLTLRRGGASAHHCAARGPDGVAPAPR